MKTIAPFTIISNRHSGDLVVTTGVVRAEQPQNAEGVEIIEALVCNRDGVPTRLNTAGGARYCGVSVYTFDGRGGIDDYDVIGTADSDTITSAMAVRANEARMDAERENHE